MRIKTQSILFITILAINSTLMAGGSQSLGGITLTEVVPRVVTPNGDLLNDVIYFKFDNTLSGIPIESDVYDVHGAKVSDLSLSSDETALVWNGKDQSGRNLPSGIYIYAIKLGDKQATGTVVVAK
jgi:gliding motility-associated-like protein